MNGTRRGVNRTLLALLGLLLVGAGAMAILAGTRISFARDLTAAGTRTWERIQENLAVSRIPGTDTSWWSAAVFAFLIVVAVLLVCWIASQGTGRSNQLATQEKNDSGKTTVDSAVAEDIIKAALAGNTQVLSSSVQSWQMKGVAGGTGLKISVQARKGASPAELSAAVERLVNGLDELLGTQLPVLVRIKAGTRTRFARTERVA